MKKLSFIFALAAATLAVSCDNNYVNPYDIPVDYYVCGQYQNSTNNSAIYKNADIIYTTDAGVHLCDIARDGNDLYAIGNKDLKPYLSKNGEAQTLTALGGKNGELFKIYIIDNVRYICGYYKDGDKDVGFIMQNEEIKFTRENCKFTVMDFGASGDIYAGGGIDGEPKCLRIEKSGWTQKDSIVFNKTGIPGQFALNDIYVGNRDITAALTCTNGDDVNAYGWVDDVLFPLSSKESEANCTAIYNGWIAMGGYIRTSTGMDATACQWGSYRGGFIAEDFSYGCNPGGSAVVLLYNGGYNLYQVVESAGQLQLCRNGQLRVRIDCTDDFHATGWLVIRK